MRALWKLWSVTQGSVTIIQIIAIYLHKLKCLLRCDLRYKRTFTWAGRYSHFWGFWGSMSEIKEEKSDLRYIFSWSTLWRLDVTWRRLWCFSTQWVPLSGHCLCCACPQERERLGGGGHKCEMESPSALLWAVGVWVEMAGPVNRWLEWSVPFGRAGGNLSRATAYPRLGMSVELWFKDGNQDRKKKTISLTFLISHSSRWFWINWTLAEKSAELNS